MAQGPVKMRMNCSLEKLEILLRSSGDEDGRVVKAFGLASPVRARSEVSKKYLRLACAGTTQDRPLWRTRSSNSFCLRPRLHPTIFTRTPLIIIAISSGGIKPTLLNMFSFEKLPSELHYCIADYLPPQCLDVLNRTSRHLHSISEHFIYFRAINRTRAIKSKRYKAGRIYPIPVRLGKLGTVQQITRFCDLYE